MGQAAVRAKGPILLTGFEPFEGLSVNPSWEIVSALAGDEIEGRTVEASILPVDFHASVVALKALLIRHCPSMVVCTGVALSRQVISFERVAVNLIDARVPDNSGRQPRDTAVVQDGPAAYFSSLPISPMLAAFEHAQCRAEVSLSAGSYVCNTVFYALMHELRSRPEVPAGFVHFPNIKSGVRTWRECGALTMDQATDGFRDALITAVQPKTTPSVLRFGTSLP